jgi:hypothetical protein
MGANTYRLMSGFAAGEMPEGTDEFSADEDASVDGLTGASKVDTTCRGPGKRARPRTFCLQSERGLQAPRVRPGPLAGRQRPAPCCPVRAAAVFRKGVLVGNPTEASGAPGANRRVGEREPGRTRAIDGLPFRAGCCSGLRRAELHVA